MMLPLELHNMSQRLGHLSPGLALGWRIGTWVKEYFDGLEDLHMATREDGDVAFAIEQMARGVQGTRPLRSSNATGSWDWLFYHPGTTTLVRFEALSESVKLPADPRVPPAEIAQRGISVSLPYQGAVTLLVSRILTNPLESLCVIEEKRCRPLPYDGTSPLETLVCEGCGRRCHRLELVYVEDAIRCHKCAEVLASWFLLH